VRIRVVADNIIRDRPMPSRTEQLRVSLTPALARYVRRNVKAGLYNDESEVLRDALRRLIRAGDSQAANEPDPAEHRRLVADGVAAVERGQYTDYDQDGLKRFFAAVSERGRKRLEAQSE
jgi:putative addiction module CopG family antidote